MTLGTVTKLDIPAAGGPSRLFDVREPEAILEWALSAFGTHKLAFLTSFQVDGMAIIDMAWRLDRNIRVATIDTGRLPAETYEMIDRVRDRYGIDVEVTFPDPADVEPLIRQHGINLFYESEALRVSCCEVRKSRPLARLLEEFDAWVTGLRRDQASSRAEVAVVEADLEHGGRSKSILWRTGPRIRSGIMSERTTCPHTHSTLKATQVSAARRVRDRSRSERIRAPGVGGGSSRISRNVAFTIPRTPMVTWWQVGCASRPMTDAPDAAASAQRDTHPQRHGALQLSRACA